MSPRYGPPNPIHRQSGLAMVEFAVSVPVILLLMFGSFEFGHLMTEFSALNDGVRDAARYVAANVRNGSAIGMDPLTPGDTLYKQGQNLAVFGKITGTAGTDTPIFPGLTVADISLTENTTSQTITVIAAYPYLSLFGGASLPTFMGSSLATNYTLTISTTMRAL